MLVTELSTIESLLLFPKPTVSHMKPISDLKRAFLIMYYLHVWGGFVFGMIYSLGKFVAP